MRFVSALLVALSLGWPALAEAPLGDDGLHKSFWMHNDTFKDLREDLAEADAQGKRFVLLWEQRGCIYCTRMHQEVLPRPEIESLLDERYFVVQLNLFGDVEVTDFDGEVLVERDMAMKWGVMFTPTFMFFPPEVAEGIDARAAAVVNMPGAFGAGTMFNLLNWVLEEGYLGDENFQKYHARMFNARQAEKAGDE